MSQQMNILRCYSCKMYQVHIVKKAKKWQCKVCNHKQTLKQVYFKGSGNDCRKYVQKLNLMKEYENQMNQSFHGENSINDNFSASYFNPPKVEVAENKWTKYLNKSEDVQFDSLESSCNENHIYEKNNDSMYLHNNSAAYKCSQNDYVHIKNNSKQDINCDNDEKYDIVETKETFDNALTSESNKRKNDFHCRSVNDTKRAKSIFDDNEDFDLSIDF